MNNFNYTRPPITNYQKAIVDSLACCTVSESSVKVGKTTSHIIWLFEQALQGKKEDNFLFVAPNFLLVNIAFNRMKAQVSYPHFFNESLSKLRLTLPNGTYIWFKSADEPNALCIDDLRAVVFDEFGRFYADGIKEAINEIISNQNCKAKFIGNVMDKLSWQGKLITKAKIYTKENKDKNLENPEYEYFKITAYDAVKENIITKKELEEAKRDLPRDTFEFLYLITN